MRFNFAELLPPKYEIFKKLTFLLKFSDFSLNLFSDLRFTLSRKYKIKLKYVFDTHILNDSYEFIDKKNNEYWNRRGPKDINWILQYPWLIEQAEDSADSSRYYFSLKSKRFKNMLIKFYNNENVVGIVFLNIRDHRLTVPYIFADNDSIDEVSKVLINTMIEYKLNMITTFNDALISSLHRIKPNFIFKKEIKKPYFISKKLEKLEGLHFQDGDGDCAFY